MVGIAPPTHGLLAVNEFELVGLGHCCWAPCWPGADRAFLSARGTQRVHPHTVWGPHHNHTWHDTTMRLPFAAPHPSPAYYSSAPTWPPRHFSLSLFLPARSVGSSRSRPHRRTVAASRLGGGRPATLLRCCLSWSAAAAAAPALWSAAAAAGGTVWAAAPCCGGTAHTARVWGLRGFRICALPTANGGDGGLTQWLTKPGH
jgi:hypothetical protein